MTAPTKTWRQTTAKSADKIKKDAKGQFAQKRNGGENDGLVSANPRAVSGDGDATFQNHPEKDHSRK